MKNRAPSRSAEGHCKVCEGNVAKRQTYFPSVCEACQKFFRRKSQTSDFKKLKCSCNSYKPGAKIGRKKWCGKCRFDKCIAVGMTTKYLNQRRDSEGMDSEPVKVDFAESNNLSVVSYPSQPSPSVILNPAIFDGAGVENHIRLSLAAFAELAELDQVVLSSPDSQIYDLEAFIQCGPLMLNQLRSIFFNYSQTFASQGMLTSIPNNELPKIVISAVPLILLLVKNLPSNRGSRFFGIRDYICEILAPLFPTIDFAREAVTELSNLMSVLNPSIVDISLLSAMVLFNSNSPENSILDETKKKLQLAWDLYVLYSSGNNSKTLEAKQRLFRLVMKTAHEATSRLTSVLSPQIIPLLPSNLIGPASYALNDLRPFAIEFAADAWKEDPVTISILSNGEINFSTANAMLDEQLCS